MTHTEELVDTLVQHKRHRGPLTDKQWEFVYELWCFGYTPQELGSWLMVHPSTISYHFKRLGFTSTDRLPLSAYDEKLWKLGDSHV